MEWLTDSVKSCNQLTFDRMITGSVSRRSYSIAMVYIEKASIIFEIK